MFKFIRTINYYEIKIFGKGIDEKMDFIKELKDIISDKKYGYDEDQVMISTGFNTLDFLNGNVIVKDDGKKEYNLGIDSGKIITIIGKAGVGKSTLAIQIAHNLIKRYDQSSLFILDFEQSNTKNRIRMVTGMTEQEVEDKVSIKKVGISTETVLQIASQIKQLKVEHKKQLLVDNKEGILDENGKLVKILPPTVMMIDSIAMMMPADAMKTEEMSGQMVATQAAKANTQLFKRLVQICMEGNIIPIFINHVLQMVSTGPMPVAAGINYLKQDETLPGGRAAQYLTNTLIKVTASSKLKEDEKYKVKGYMTKVELIKSRTAPAGRAMTMIYDQAEGFDEDLSLLNFIKDNKGLKGSPRSYHLDGYEDMKFIFSNFKEKLASSLEFRAYFENMGKTYLEDSLKESSKYQSAELRLNDLEDNISEDGMNE